MMDETERKALIESDVWAGEVTAISVECKGCGKTVSLDKRSMYYPGLWIKHRSKCPAIRRLEGRTEKLDVSWYSRSFSCKNKIKYSFRNAPRKNNEKRSAGDPEKQWSSRVRIALHRYILAKTKTKTCHHQLIRGINCVTTSFRPNSHLQNPTQEGPIKVTETRISIMVATDLGKASVQGSPRKTVQVRRGA